MIFTSPGEIAFSVFNYQIRWYGLFMFFAIISGILLVRFLSKCFYREYDEDFLIDLSLVLVVSGIIGARLYYVLMDFGYYLRHPVEIFAIWQGGLSIHGAILLAVISGGIFTVKKGFSFLKTADLFTFALVLGQMIGRWGNFFNSEAFGLPCDLPWKLYIPLDSRPLGYLFYDFFHPAFLYESIGSGVILAVFLLLRFYFKEIKAGTIFFLYLILYSSLRMVIETIRIDSVLSFGPFHIAHIMSAVLILTGITGLVWVNKRIN